MAGIRPAAVAGAFYPADADALKCVIDHMLGDEPPASGPAPRALIVPHAAYVYSGPVAGRAYARLRPFAAQYRRVLLLGPSHFVPLSGLAQSADEAFRTPLGDVPVDLETIAGLDHDSIATSGAAHRREHSLEVQLPFLQRVLPDFSLVPLVVGDTDEASLAEIIESFWVLPESLVVVSSDLSHYHDYRAARRRDRATCRAIEALDGAGIGFEQACGAAPVRGLLAAARARGMQAVTLDLRNSGDTAGDADRVVGYGAWMVIEPESGRQAA